MFLDTADDPEKMRQIHGLFPGFRGERTAW
jgi:hypothetical protein